MFILQKDLEKLFNVTMTIIKLQMTKNLGKYHSLIAKESKQYVTIL